MADNKPNPFQHLSDEHCARLDQLVASWSDAEASYIRQALNDRLERDEAASQQDWLAHPYGVKFIGPMEDEWLLSADGYEVPYLTVQPNILDEEGDTALSCDHRHMIVGTDLEVRKWVRFIADCMAVAAGFASIRSPRPMNRHRVRMSGIEVIERDDSQQKGSE